jgi:ABC-type uncharacterized transport system auxiliary subunit
LHWWLLWVIGTIVMGCGAARPIKYYQLNVGSLPSPEAQPTIPATILLGPILTSHLYRDDRIVYSSNGVTMGTYEFHRWGAAPVEMISDVLFRTLRDEAHFRGVYAMRSSTHADYVLRGHLYDFKEVSGSALVARLAMDFELRDSKAGAIVWTHSYNHDEPVDKKEVAAVATALDRNVQMAVAEVTNGLDQYFASHPIK